MPTVSEDLQKTDKSDAMSKFCIEASRYVKTTVIKHLDFRSPFALNCHLYGLRRHKMDNTDNAVLGINARYPVQVDPFSMLLFRGIEMCDVGEDGERVPLRFLPWKKVTKLSFDRKKIGIMGADGTKMSLYAQSESKARYHSASHICLINGFRYLLELCRSVHQTLLVLSHKSAINGNFQLPFTEKNVDRASTSSGTGAHTSEGNNTALF